MRPTKDHAGGKSQSLIATIIGVVVVLLLLIGMLGWWYFISEKRRIRTDAQIYLTAIAELKVKRISDWRDERIADARVFMANRSNLELLAQIINGSTTATIDSSREWLESLCMYYDYESAMLIDPEGKQYLNIGQPNEIPQDLISMALEEVIPLFSEIHRERNGEGLHIDFVIPLTHYSAIPGSPPFGLLLLTIDVDAYLFQEIQSWPTPSRSGESLLVRQDGDDVVFLNQLRHRPDPGLTIKIPTAQMDLPAVMAVKGVKGAVTGKDYRGIPVLAVTRKIPDFNWYMICKEDLAEIDEPLRHELLPVLIGAVALIAAAGGFIGLRWHQKSSNWLTLQLKHQKQRLQMESKLRREQKRFRIYFDESMVGMAISSPEKGWLEANDRLLRMLGYAWDDLKSKTWADITHPDDLPRGLEALQKILSGEQEGYSINTRIINRNQQIVPTILSVRAFRNPDGSIEYLFLQVQDMTEHLENEMRYRTIFSFAPVAILEEDWSAVFELIEHLDEKSLSHFSSYLIENPGFIAQALSAVDICDINGETLTVFGAKTKAELLPFLKEIFSAPENAPRFGDCLHALIDGQPFFKTELTLCGVNGRQLHILLNVAFPRSGSYSGTVLVSITDLTDRKIAEKRLKQFSDDLKLRNQELESFAYVSSHDLQEPLRTISSFSQLLASRYRGQLDSDADEFIQFIVDGVTRMQTLIRDLLTYSRLGTRGKPFAKVQCDIIIQDVLSDLSLNIKETNTKVDHDPLPIVMGDDVQLRQLFQNLIGNAIKFQAAGKAPRVQVKVKPDPLGWRFEVRDNGIGIDSQYFERIFVIFQRLHGPDSYSGTGIGLAMCKKIVERHGGRIWVESEPEKGSIFYFILPRIQESST